MLILGIPLHKSILYVCKLDQAFSAAPPAGGRSLFLSFNLTTTMLD